MKRFNSLQELFANEKRWCQGTYARSKLGNKVNPTSPKAVSFCLMGGIKKVYGSYNNKAWDKLETTLHTKFVDNTFDVVWFNDMKSTTIKKIRKLVKLAKV